MIALEPFLQKKALGERTFTFFEPFRKSAGRKMYQFSLGMKHLSL